MMAFMLYGAALEEFFKRCDAREAVTEKERTEILIEMAKEGWIASVTQTNRTKEQYVEDLKKNYGKILECKPKPKDEE